MLAGGTCTGTLSLHRRPTPLSLTQDHYNPRGMVQNGPNERTSASSETCLYKAARVGETALRIHLVPSAAPLAGRVPIPAASQNSSIHPASARIRSPPLSCLFAFPSSSLSLPLPTPASCSFLTKTAHARFFESTPLPHIILLPSPLSSPLFTSSFFAFESPDTVSSSLT